MAVPSPRCGICGTVTRLNFKFDGKIYFCCEAHKVALFEKVTGEKFNTRPELKQ